MKDEKERKMSSNDKEIQRKRGNGCISFAVYVLFSPTRFTVREGGGGRVAYPHTFAPSICRRSRTREGKLC
ncbi:hypothetical protein, unlikely [Trypanosoma brucei brucei TREU927]|uniref:Uncharacterized protein n=1 Tax=Trypanosoma brucei brucei (strain 927/4 GUTat10.1) TaxID=185431 RepID=Q38DF5_TRYB2|nr:hypothetical protein, unlikely [Trypanosoma brucei brucei TREU927]EAN77165.1 hypothetical protein, unlikely [Trypanosoma brucei brucei TREU927]